MNNEIYTSTAVRRPGAPARQYLRADIVYLNSVLRMMRRHGISKSTTAMLLNYAAHPELLEPGFPRRKVHNPGLIQFTGRAVIVNEAALDRVNKNNVIYR